MPNRRIASRKSPILHTGCFSEVRYHLIRTSEGFILTGTLGVDVVTVVFGKWSEHSSERALIVLLGFYRILSVIQYPMPDVAIAETLR